MLVSFFDMVHSVECFIWIRHQHLVKQLEGFDFRKSFRVRHSRHDRRCGQYLYEIQRENFHDASEWMMCLNRTIGTRERWNATWHYFPGIKISFAVNNELDQRLCGWPILHKSAHWYCKKRTFTNFLPFQGRNQNRLRKVHVLFSQIKQVTTDHYSRYRMKWIILAILHTLQRMFVAAWGMNQ